MELKDGTISIPEAIVLFNISEATLRRRISRGEVPGAFRIRGRRGPEWRIPVASLEELGYEKHRSSDAKSSTELSRVVENLTLSLLAERARWEEWDRRLGAAQAKIARLKAELHKERIRTDELRSPSGERRRQGVVILDPHSDDAPRT